MIELIGNKQFDDGDILYFKAIDDVEQYIIYSKDIGVLIYRKDGQIKFGVADAIDTNFFKLVGNIFNLKP
jgi:hypothetical protein